MLEDLGSKNGTLLNGTRIAEAVSLQDGDEIRLGSVDLTYRSNSGFRSTLTYGGP
jgi:pSer/pThr/pTyr-binding forkhead associated (FHA) protein